MSTSQGNAHAFAPLQGAEFAVLTTYRASGDPVPTTVWFAEHDGAIYITTNRRLGKVKRILRNPAVELAASDRVGNVEGPAVAARARLLEPEQSQTAREALERKYGEQYRMMTERMDGSQPIGSRVFLEVLPA